MTGIFSYCRAAALDRMYAVTYPRLKPGACPHLQGAGRASGPGDLVSRMSRSTVARPRRDKSWVYPKPSRAAPARAAVTAQSSCTIRHRSLALALVLAVPGSVSLAPPCVPSRSGRVLEVHSRAGMQERQSASTSDGASPHRLKPGAPAPHRRWRTGANAIRGVRLSPISLSHTY